MNNLDSDIIIKKQFQLEELQIYGISRHGIYKPKTMLLQNTYRFNNLDRAIDIKVTTLSYNYFKRTLTLKQYELTNHLGNVLATVLDRKTFVQDSTGADTLLYYKANVSTATLYYAFGSAIQEMSYGSDTSNKYRFGFNGEELMDELAGEDMAYDLGARFYDARLGRMYTIDPLSLNYPLGSCYSYLANSPIAMLDQDGAGPIRPATVIPEVPGIAPGGSATAGGVGRAPTPGGAPQQVSYGTKVESKVATKTVTKQAVKSSVIKVAGKILSKGIPFVGWATVVYDVYELTYYNPYCISPYRPSNNSTDNLSYINPYIPIGTSTGEPQIPAINREVLPNYVPSDVSQKRQEIYSVYLTMRNKKYLNMPLPYFGITKNHLSRTVMNPTLGADVTSYRYPSKSIESKEFKEWVATGLTLDCAIRVESCLIILNSKWIKSAESVRASNRIDNLTTSSMDYDPTRSVDGVRIQLGLNYD